MTWTEHPVITYILLCPDGTYRTVKLPSFSKDGIQHFLDMWKATIKSATISGNLCLSFNCETEDQVPDWLKQYLVI